MVIVIKIFILYVPDPLIIIFNMKGTLYYKGIVNVHFIIMCFGFMFIVKISCILCSDSNFLSIPLSKIC
jgi:hypothetical protein